MGLTQAARLRLEGKGFEKLFQDHEAIWAKLAEGARALIAAEIKPGEPTVDDIKKTLLPLLEINPHLQAFLSTKKLIQKYWTNDFTDYVLHKVYQPKLKQKGGHAHHV